MIFFDFETVINWKHSGVLVPYSLTVRIVNDPQRDRTGLVPSFPSFIESLENADTSVVDDKYFIGMDCINQFLDYFKERFLQESKDYKTARELTEAGNPITTKPRINQNIINFVSYNGSNFDNYIFLNHLINSKDEIFKITNVSFNGNQILTMAINGQYGFFDLCKHLTCSLTTACSSFKISDKIAKTELNHVVIQRLFEKMGEEAFIKMLKDAPESGVFKKYIINDVASLSVLYYTYENTFAQIGDVKEIFGKKGLTNIKTLGSLVWKI